MAPVARTLVVKKATFQDNVKAALMGGKQSAQAVLKHVVQGYPAFATKYRSNIGREIPVHGF